VQVAAPDLLVHPSALMIPNRPSLTRGEKRNRFSRRANGFVVEVRSLSVATKWPNHSPRTSYPYAIPGILTFIHSRHRPASPAPRPRPIMFHGALTPYADEMPWQGPPVGTDLFSRGSWHCLDSHLRCPARKIRRTNTERVQYGRSLAFLLVLVLCYCSRLHLSARKNQEIVCHVSKWKRTKSHTPGFRRLELQKPTPKTRAHASRQCHKEHVNVRYVDFCLWRRKSGPF